MSIGLLKRKSLYKNIVNRLEELSRIGVDVREYSSLVDDYNKLSCKELENVSTRLDKYSYCYRLDKLLSDLGNNILSDDVCILVNKCKECLIFLSGIKNVNYREIDGLVMRLYGVVYEVIKREVLETDRSYLLDYINSNTNYIFMLEKVVERDIVANGLDKIDMVQKKLEELKKQKFVRIYTNFELIYAIAYAYKRINNSIDEVKKIRELYKEFSLNNDEIEKSVYGCFKSGNGVFGDKISYKNDSVRKVGNRLGVMRRSINRRIISIALSASVVGGVGGLVLPRVFSRNYYRTVKCIYNENGVMEDSSCNYLLSFDSKYIIEIRDCDSYRACEDGYERNVVSYFINSDSLEEIDNYIDMDMRDYKGKSDVETKNSLSNNDFYSGKIREVVVLEQDREDVRYGNDIVSLSLIAIFEFFLGIAVIVCEMFSLLRDKSDLYVGIINNMKYLVKEIKAKKVIDGEYRQEIRELEKLIYYIIPFINSNIDIRDKVNEYYDEMVRKYGSAIEIEEFYKKINMVKYDNINDNINGGYKLIKKRK